MNYQQAVPGALVALVCEVNGYPAGSRGLLVLTLGLVLADVLFLGRESRALGRVVDPLGNKWVRLTDLEPAHGPLTQHELRYALSKASGMTREFAAALGRE